MCMSKAGANIQSNYSVQIRRERERKWNSLTGCHCFVYHIVFLKLFMWQKYSQSLQWHTGLNWNYFKNKITKNQKALLQNINDDKQDLLSLPIFLNQKQLPNMFNKYLQVNWLNTVNSILYITVVVNQLPTDMFDTVQGCSVCNTFWCYYENCKGVLSFKKMNILWKRQAIIGCLTKDCSPPSHPWATWQSWSYLNGKCPDMPSGLRHTDTLLDAAKGASTKYWPEEEYYCDSCNSYAALHI